MSNQNRKILVTCALPYANGAIHLGHMLEHIQADIWVRFQRMRGNEVHFVCADDAHGTPIMLNAAKQGITPEQLIEKAKTDHVADFKGFNISFDNYHSTHSEENREFSEFIYNRLKENGFIKSRTISQLYDPEKGMFLPDRFVKGTCPKCKSPDQYSPQSTYTRSSMPLGCQLLSGHRVSESSFRSPRFSRSCRQYGHRTALLRTRSQSLRPLS